MLTTKLPKWGEKREPLKIENRHFVELLSYGEKNAFGHALIEAKKHFKGRTDLTVLEVGALRGHNAENIANELNPNLLILVDPWELAPNSLEYQDNNWAETYYRVQGKKNVVVLKATSGMASRLLHIKFDFIYIDGDHADINKDIRLWKDRVNKGGIFAGHDYNYDNVKEAVHTWLSEYKISTSPYHPHGGMDWWVFV